MGLERLGGKLARKIPGLIISETRQAKATGKRGHALLGEFFAGIQCAVDSGDDQIGQQLGVSVFDDVLGYGECFEQALATCDGFNSAAAGGSLKGHASDFFLRFDQAGLHFLGLFHEFLDVHGEKLSHSQA